ncbi:hypothetical protein ACIBF1_45610 [Spirillospora sp. NPDC050679]
MKAFNTAGPCHQDKHYMLDPLVRLPEARGLVERGEYFVVHAPRQAGKTTALFELAQELNGTGQYAAVRFSCETARVTGDDVGSAELLVLHSIHDAASWNGMPSECLPPDPWPQDVPGAQLLTGLRDWAARCPRPLVLLFDEIDTLRGQSLVSVLRQLSDGFNARPLPFPHSVVLCGMRNVPDCRASLGGDPDRPGTSALFDISAASLRIGEFSFAQVADLYGQHTAATGQRFTDDAVRRAFEASRGQPWLVNSLARDIIERMRIPPTEPITGELVERAVERIIAERGTHLDSLVARLREPRVRRTLEPVIAGAEGPPDDLSYVRDLGLLTRSGPLRISNPIYEEVTLRFLGQELLTWSYAEPRRFVRSDGQLDVPALLEEFVTFWKAESAILDAEPICDEAAYRLVLMAFLQRVAPSGAYVDREYAVGRQRVDVMVRKPYTGADGRLAVQWSAFELKVRTDESGDPVPAGLEQLDGYLDRLGLDTGTLVVFDRRRAAPPAAERTRLAEGKTPKGRAVTLLHA